MFRYKRWTNDGWRALAAALAGRGLAVVATGGPAEAERRYLDEVWSGIDVRRRRRPQLARACGAARRRPRLCRTRHLGDPSCRCLRLPDGRPLRADRSARCGRPGRSAGSLRPGRPPGPSSAAAMCGSSRIALPCTPCQKEGCARHLDSHSQCLDELSVQQVLRAVDQALAGAPRAGWRERA